MAKKQKQKIESADPAELARQCREAAGHVTISASCKATGISVGTQQRVEHGEQNPSVGCLRELLNKLGFCLTLVARKK